MHLFYATTATAPSPGQGKSQVPDMKKGLALPSVTKGRRLLQDGLPHWPILIRVQASTSFPVPGAMIFFSASWIAQAISSGLSHGVQAVLTRAILSQAM